MTGIPPKSFAVLYSELERWSVDYFRRIEWQWPPELIQPIGHVVQLKKVEVDHQVKKALLPIIEKISFGGQISVSKPERRIKYKGRLLWADA